MVICWSSAWRWVGGLAIIAGCQGPARAGYTIMDLGVVAPSGTTSSVAGINGKGQVSGTVISQSGGMVAARSTTGGLQAVVVPSDAVSSMATSINGGGVVAGYYTDKNGIQHGFFSTGSGASALDPLMENGLTGTSTRANGINDGGTVVGTGDLGSNITRAFTALGGVTKIIDPLAANASDQGNGINGSGTVVGSSQISPGGMSHAFFTVTNLDGSLTAVDLTAKRNTKGNFQFNTFGIAIANDNDIVGYGDVSGSEHAFFASASGGPLVDLGTLANASSSMAMSVNDYGFVVGVSGSSAFLWDASDGMFDLNSLLSKADQSNWTLTEAAGINDSGQISGEGYLNGVLHGFVLTAVPEPPAGLLASLGLALALGCTRFRRGRTGGRAGV